MDMKKKFEIRHTGRPFGPYEPMGDDDFQFTVSAHATLLAARKRLSVINAENAEVWGQNAWGDHYRIFATEDVRMTSQCATNRTWVYPNDDTNDGSYTAECSNRCRFIWPAESSEPITERFCPECASKNRNATKPIGDLHHGNMPKC